MGKKKQKANGPKGQQRKRKFAAIRDRIVSEMTMRKKQQAKEARLVSDFSID
jgi:hypothetical protein